eukprot:CAMPEP_0178993204 /NCGR_PEP_ID=MMETSP0795-20121207/6571_1 /TAXON_ID=88552 /ORGANISM="Amoebophrya sp., Strain Ameob2" /LENGTH=873 /DNA_ID=CAMNT_0020685233 /DNA_START=45 /DNA_END=2666 /DNA_ORIENTATION=+
MTEVFATQSSTLGGHNSFPAFPFAPVPQPQQQVQVAGTTLLDVPYLNALTAVEQKAVAPDGNATAAPRDPSAEVPPPVVETPEQRRERALATLTLSEADIKSNGQIVQHIGEVALRGRVNFQQLSQLAQRYGIDPELFAEGVQSSPVAASTSTDFDDYNTLPGTRTVTLCEYSEADLLVRILRLPPLLPYPLEQLTELQSRIQTGAFVNAEEGLILQLLQILTREAEKEQTNPQGRRRARDSGPHFSAFSDALQDEYGTSILSLASKRGWLGVVEYVLNECVPAAGDEVETAAVVDVELLERTELHLRADRATDADALAKELEKKRKTWLEQAAVRPAEAEKNAGGVTGGTTSDSAAVPQPVLRIPPPDAGMTLPPGAGAPAAVPTSARSGGGTTKRVTFSEQPAPTMLFGPNEGILNPAMAGSPFGGAGTPPAALGAAPPGAPADNCANPFNSFNNPNPFASSFAPSPPAVESAAAAAPNPFGGPSSTALPLPSPFAPPVPTAAASGAASGSTAPNPFAPSPSPFAPSPSPFAAPPNPFAPTNPTPAPDPNNPFAVTLPAASATAGAPPPSPFAPQEPPAFPFGFATATGGTQPSHSQAPGVPTSTFPPQVQIQIPAPSTTIDSKAVISSAATTTGTLSSGGDGTTTSAGTIAGASEATPSSASTAPPATYYNTAQFRENTQLLFDPHVNTHEFDCSPRRKLKASDRMVAYVNRPNRMGWTALLLAAQSGGPAVCKKLLDSRADVDVEASATKLTPLMVAGTRSSLAIVELLLNYRADVWKMNVVGQSVVEIVKNKKHMRDQKLKFARIGGTGSEEGVLDAKGKPMDLYGIGGPISLEEGKDLGAIEELLLRVTQGKELQKITPALNSSAAK